MNALKDETDVEEVQYIINQKKNFIKKEIVLIKLNMILQHLKYFIKNLRIRI